MSTRAGRRRTGPYTDRTRWLRIARGEGERALRPRRLAFAATVAAFAAWLVTGAGSDAGRVSREFAFTGGRAQYVVPAGVCRVHIEAAGASGGLQGAAGTPGLGARVAATLRVSPAETLLVHVGGQGGTAVGATPGRGGWNGGGDGGAAARPRRRTAGPRGLRRRRGDRRPARRGTARGPRPGRRCGRRGRRRRDRRPLRHQAAARAGARTGHDGFAPLGIRQSHDRRTRRNTERRRRSRHERARRRGHGDRRIAGSRRHRRERRRERGRRRWRRTLRRRRRRHRVPVDDPPPRRGPGWRRLELRPAQRASETACGATSATGR